MPKPITTKIRDLSPPGEILAEALVERGMTGAELARRMGVSEEHVDQLLNSKAPLSLDVAVGLERVLGIPANLWRTLESNFRREERERESTKNDSRQR